MVLRNARVRQCQIALVGLLIILCGCDDNPTQPCQYPLSTSSGHVRIGSQAVLDTLPRYMEILGDLIIGGNIGPSDITNLSRLACLTRIEGRLFIGGNGSLRSLEALASLREVGGSMQISSNPLLRSLTGLENIAGFAGRLLISRNASLENLQGLPDLSAALEIQLEGIPNLTDFSEFGDLPSLKSLTIYNQDGLTNLAGLGPTPTLSKLAIYNCDSFETCSQTWKKSTT